MFHPRNDIRIVKLTLQETGTYNQMYQRPMATYLDASTLDGIVDVVEQAAIRRPSPAMLSGLSYSVIAPSAIPGDSIMIPNGWDNKRIRFILEADVGNSLGRTDKYYFQGFTDYPGVSHAGSIDPKMLLIINSYIKVDLVTSYDPKYGTITKPMVTDFAQIINGEIISQAYGMNTFSLRPSDMFMGMQSAQIQAAQMDDIPVFDNRFTLKGKSVQNNGYNVAPSSYLSTVIDGYCLAKISRGIGDSSNDIYDEAKNNTYVDSLGNNNFLRRMKNNRGYGNGTVFTMSELEHLDPNISNVTNFIAIGPTHKATYHHVGQTEYWHGADRSTQCATIIGNVVPALLMELMLSKVTFMATNHDLVNKANIVILEGDSIVGADMSQFFEQFKHRIVRELLDDISYKNQLKYSMTVRSDIFGDTIVDLSLDGQPSVAYTIPTFCGSVATPMMTTNRENYFGTINSVATVVEHVADAIGNNYATSSNSSNFLI